jgi:hypothetical protein
MVEIMIKYIIYFVLFCPVYVFSQNWHPVIKTDHRVKKLAISSNNQYLIANGSFRKVNDSINVQGHFKFDGNTISTLNGILLEDVTSFQILSDSKIASFDDNIYVYGTRNTINPIYTMEGDSVDETPPENGHYHLKCNLNEWSEMGIGLSRRIKGMSVVDNILWLFESRTNYSDSFKFSMVFQNGAIINHEVPAQSSAILSATFSSTYTNLCKYNGEYYLGGSTSNNAFSIVKWDGYSVFEQIIDWQSLGNYAVSSIVEYQGKLVVAGSFNINDDGAPSNYVAVWDGQSWSPLFGEGTDASIHKLIVHNNILYFIGNFNLLYSNQGPVVASKIAWYNGIDAYPLSGDVINGILDDLVFFQDTLYIGGQFNYINFEEHSNFSQFLGPLPQISTEISETENPTQLKLIPNPFSTNLKIEFPVGHFGGELSIYDMNGKIILSQKIAINEPFLKIENDIFSNSGVYILSCTFGDGIARTSRLIYVE